MSSSVVSLQFLSDGMADLSSYGSHERDIEQVSFTTKLSFYLKKKKNVWFGLFHSRKRLEFFSIRHDHACLFQISNSIHFLNEKKDQNIEGSFDMVY